MSKKIVNYCVVEERGVDDFNVTCQQYIVKGWQPYGSFFKYGDYYYQAMVEYSSGYSNGRITWEKQ